MVRTTSQKVREVADTDSSIVMGPFIDTASSLVDWLAAQDSDGNLSSATLTLIETWLAAHFYAHKDPIAYSSKSVGRSRDVYQGTAGMNLNSTRFGQTALMLDTTGNLKSLSESKGKGRIAWLGKAYDNHDTTDPAYE
jgi:hypothetical protein